MQEVSEERNIAIARISKIVDSLIQGNNIYQQRLNKSEMVQHFVRLLDKFFPKYNIKAISDEELINRIDSILVIEALSRTLNDLTPEQIERFNESVKGR